MVAIGESLGHLLEALALRPPALFSGGGKSALARNARLGPAEGRPCRPGCPTTAGTPPLAPDTIAPNRLESPPEHPWARRSAVLPWYAGAQSALPLKSRRNWAAIRVQHRANARRGRSTWRRRSAARVFHLPRRGGKCGCDRREPWVPAAAWCAAAAGAIQCRSMGGDFFPNQQLCCVFWSQVLVSRGRWRAPNCGQTAPAHLFPGARASSYTKI